MCPRTDVVQHDDLINARDTNAVLMTELVCSTRYNELIRQPTQTPHNSACVAIDFCHFVQIAERHNNVPVRSN